MKFVQTFLSIYVIIGLTVTLAACAKDKVVSISLEAKWKDTNFVSEAIEFINEENPGLSWKLIDSMLKNGGHSWVQMQSDAQLYEHLVSFIGSELSSQKVNLYEWSLALRAYSAKIAMYRSLVNNLNVPESCKKATSLITNGEKVVCSKDAIKDFVSAKSSDMVYSFDNIHPECPPSSSDTPHLILYSDITSPDFFELHQEILNQCESKFTYVLRFYEEEGKHNTKLTGYGIELSVKSQEYKAQDDKKIEDSDEGDEDGESEEPKDLQGFIFPKLKNLYPHLNDGLNEFQSYLHASSADLVELKPWQVQDLSYQAANWLSQQSSDDCLRLMRDLTGNFPTQQNFLLKQTIDKTFKTAVEGNQHILGENQRISEGENDLFINGLSVDFEQSDIFQLLDTLKKEASLSDSLHKFGLGDDLGKFLKVDVDADSGSSEYGVDMREAEDGPLVWLNNLEKDSRYQRFGSSVRDLLQPAFPGMLRHLRKHIYNVVVVANPLDPGSFQTLQMIEAFLVHSVPIRMGLMLVPHPETKQPEDETKEARLGVTPEQLLIEAFYQISGRDKKTGGGPEEALSLLTDAIQAVGKKDSVTLADIREVLLGTSHFDEADAVDALIETILSRTSSDSTTLDAASSWLHDVGVSLASVPTTSSFRGLIFINGVPLPELKDFEEDVVGALLSATPTLQKAVYHGELTDKDDVWTWLMTRKSVLPRLSTRFLAGPDRLIPFGGSEFPADFRPWSPVPKDWTSAQANDLALKSIPHVSTGKNAQRDAAVTFWLVSNFGDTTGRAALATALKYLKRVDKGSSVRLGFISTSWEKDDVWPVAVAYAAVALLNPDEALRLATKTASADFRSRLESGATSLSNLDINSVTTSAFLDELNKRLADEQVWASASSYARSFGDFSIVVNGQVYSNLDTLHTDDFVLLERLTRSKAADAIAVWSPTADLTVKITSALLENAAHSASSSAITGSSKPPKRSDVTSGLHSAGLTVIPQRVPDSPAFEVTFVVDPASWQAAKPASFVTSLWNAVNARVTLVWNPRAKLSATPVNSFYRFVLPWRLHFDSSGSVSPNTGGAASAMTAVFSNLPGRALLSTLVHPPESWLVAPFRAKHDLDNICLDEIGSSAGGGSVHAVFRLEHLLIEGHCFDSLSGAPPRGLQFELSRVPVTPDAPPVSDTIVMANLGYFQLKAQPGLFDLHLRRGRSDNIYQISSTTHLPVVILDSFRSKSLRVQVAKKPGMAKMNLLAAGADESPEDTRSQANRENEDDDDAGAEDNSLFGSIYNTITSKFAKSKNVVVGPNETINIFSLASGHLYERFLKIMMLSVVKNTKNPVKFWFLENFLSPGFKDFVPVMAKHYGFQVELVQYKWPRWLHAQTQKQRIIWGYKILFLDVLFPLNISKIIFVDADQVVRTDLLELVNLDLEGAPYGYTPFCDSRPEMDGYRFWKHGYWASHLQHRKYHISALYVVDLERFRLIAAADRLRGQYQSLSRDPNSLANLDQDLPNNMIHQVAIKSLPQEWLWCGTWCDEASKAAAKTIDLCNNPQTKEPKLDAAMRIIGPQWKEFDDEIAALASKTASKHEHAEKFSGGEQDPNVKSDL